MTFDPKTIEALCTLRVHARYHGNPQSLRDAVDALDNAGVFAALDEQTDYASAEEILNDMTA